MNETTSVRFGQIVEFRTGRIDELNAFFDSWITKTQGQRIPHEAVICKDRDAENVYLLTVEFPSRAVAMENSGRPEVADFGAFLSSICEGPLTFRNLDVLRSESL
jgi:hypothetical protein